MNRILNRTLLTTRTVVAIAVIAVVVVVSSCSKDTLVDYEVPEFSVEDYYNLLDVTDQSFQKKYPYALNNGGEAWSIRSYFKGDPLRKAQATRLLFTNENRLASIYFREIWASKNVDRYFELLPFINNFSDDLRFIKIIFKNGDIPDDKKEFSTIEALKEWIEKESIKEGIELNVIQTEWNFPDNRRKYSESDNLSLVYVTNFTSTGAIAIHFSIGDYQFIFE